MQEVFLNTIQEFNDYQGVETLHPLVSVVHVENTEHIKECVMHYGVYVIYLKENKGCKLSYGRTPYDFDEMTVTSFAAQPHSIRQTYKPLRVFRLFQHRGVAPLHPRSGSLSRCACHDRARNSPCHRQAYPRTNRFQHRVTTELLPTLLRPPVYHPRGNQPFCGEEIHRTA